MARDALVQGSTHVSLTAVELPWLAIVELVASSLLVQASCIKLICEVRRGLWQVQLILDWQLAIAARVIRLPILTEVAHRLVQLALRTDFQILARE